MFHTAYLSHQDTHSFSKLVCDYLEQKDELKSFHAHSPNVAGVLAAIEAKKRQNIDRKALVNILKEQYKDLPRIAAVDQNIDLLAAENTFTVCTAHQPNLLGGPLYFIYKIIQTVKLSAHLNEQISTCRFVPVFYIGSEDNDLEELGHFYFYGKKYEWTTNQTGAVGRMNTEDLQSLLQDLFANMGPSGAHLEELQEIIQTCFDGKKTIAQATLAFVHRLLGYLGVLVIEPDLPAFKKQFTSVVWDDIENHTAAALVQETNTALNQHYKAQAFVRPINFFYLKDNIRERIEESEGKYRVHNTDIVFSKEDLKKELETQPERFSANVILRGVFQETILPNVVFLGGGSEVAYWMQLKKVFEFYQVPFPVVVLRQSFAILNQNTYQNIQSTGWPIERFFIEKDQLIKEAVLKDDKSVLLQQEKEQLYKLLEQIKGRAVNIDKTLAYSTEAVQTKIAYQMDILSTKMIRAEKKKQSVLSGKIAAIQEQLFPMGGLQERKVSFMEYYLKYGSAFFDMILENTLPFGDRFGVLYETEL